MLPCLSSALHGKIVMPIMWTKWSFKKILLNKLFWYFKAFLVILPSNQRLLGDKLWLPEPPPRLENLMAQNRRVQKLRVYFSLFEMSLPKELFQWKGLFLINTWKQTWNFCSPQEDDAIPQPPLWLCAPVCVCGLVLFFFFPSNHTDFIQAAWVWKAPQQTLQNWEWDRQGESREQLGMGLFGSLLGDEKTSHQSHRDWQSRASFHFFLNLNFF